MSDIDFRYTDTGSIFQCIKNACYQLNLAGLVAAANAVSGIAMCEGFQKEEAVGRLYICEQFPNGQDGKYMRMYFRDSKHGWLSDLPPTQKNTAPEKSNQVLHNKIREYREALGMTQEELAKKAGISRPFLSTVETGAAIPTVAKAADIAAALETTVDELFKKEESA